MADKTWSNFMTFFRRAHKELKQSRPTLKDITLNANVMEQEKDDLQQAILQLQLQSQEHILKTTLEQNQKQMSTMMEQMMKKLAVMQTPDKSNEPAEEPPEKKKRQRKPRVVKYCSKCHKNGCSAFKFGSHNDNDCKTYT